MENSPRLYGLLLEMQKAAEERKKQSLVALNLQFSHELENLKPSTQRYENGSLADLYDLARNSFLYSIDETIARTEKRRLAQIQRANELIARIPKPGS